ncbi:hypothetical protein AB0B45_33120 [Nonomuraea sp. NPDC049152]|uniref:hypothetical protein n=1 Tax=Nonomuraea sp. NPDC049152 TaxID=3154350 RepID=UPI0033C33389
MREHFVWVTTRRIKPGTLEEFERAWRPDPYPQGLRHAYAYWSEDQREITGVSFLAELAGGCAVGPVAALPPSSTRKARLP